MIIKLILLFLVFLIAYNLGYISGKKNAYKIAKASILLEYLEVSLKKGVCKLCNKKI